MGRGRAGNAVGRALARLIAIVANWWNVFCRLAEGGRHMEAVTSRPMLMDSSDASSRAGARDTCT